jgi:hypothetical protein
MTKKEEAIRRITILLQRRLVVSGRLTEPEIENLLRHELRNVPEGRLVGT